LLGFATQKRLRAIRGVELDTVGVWGSNPHAPTNPFNKLARTTSFSVDPKRSINDAKAVTFWFNRRHLTAHPVHSAAT
jgi:hypothetical protein